MKKIIVLFCVMLFLSCGKDDESTKNPKKIDMVTGIVLKDDSGLLWGNLGNPNIKIDYNELSVFPNPVVNSIQIENKSGNSITDVWFVKSNTDKNYKNIDFEALFNNNTYSKNDISSISKYDFIGIDRKSINLDLKNFEEGYYKVFVNSNNIIHWDNIYINKTGVEITELENYWK